VPSSLYSRAIGFRAKHHHHLQLNEISRFDQAHSKTDRVIAPERAKKSRDHFSNRGETDGPYWPVLNCCPLHCCHHLLFWRENLEEACTSNWMGRLCYILT
jgi:hypothetical protein